MKTFDLRAIRRLHIFMDAILVSLGWLGAYGLRFALNDVIGAPIHHFPVYVRALPLNVAPWMLTCWIFGIYRSVRMTTLVEEFQALFRGVGLGLLVVATIGFYLGIAWLGVENDTFGTYIWSFSIGDSSYSIWQEYALYFTLPMSAIGFAVGQIFGKDSLPPQKEVSA